MLVLCVKIVFFITCILILYAALSENLKKNMARVVSEKVADPYYKQWSPLENTKNLKKIVKTIMKKFKFTHNPNSIHCALATPGHPVRVPVPV